MTWSCFQDWHEVSRTIPIESSLTLHFNNTVSYPGISFRFDNCSAILAWVNFLRRFCCCGVNAVAWVGNVVLVAVVAVVAVPDEVAE